MTLFLRRGRNQLLRKGVRRQRRLRRNAAGSPPRSRISTSADATTTPSTCGASRSTCSRLRMPKPAHTGSGETRFTRAKYSSTSAGNATFLTGRTCHRHCVDETAAGSRQHLDALGRSHWRDELHQRQPAFGERGSHVFAFFERQIGNDEAGDAGARCIVRQSIETVRQQRIEVAHQQQWRAQLRARTGEFGKNPFERHALRERYAAGALNRGAVRHRIGERHADLDDVGRVRDCGEQRQEGLTLRKSCGDIADERGPSARLRVTDRFGDHTACSHHCTSFSKVRCSVGMSLSPRPDKPTRIFAPGCCAA